MRMRKPQEEAAAVLKVLAAVMLLARKVSLLVVLPKAALPLKARLQAARLKVPEAMPTVPEPKRPVAAKATGPEVLAAAMLLVLKAALPLRARLRAAKLKVPAAMPMVPAATPMVPEATPMVPEAKRPMAAKATGPEVLVATMLLVPREVRRTKQSSTLIVSSPRLGRS
jgi:hypothetical protein